MLRSGTFRRFALTGVALGGALVGVLVADLGEAQDGRAVATTSFAGPPSFADVIEQVSPAVVNIAVTKQTISYTAGQGGYPLDDLFERFGFGGQQWDLPKPAPRKGEGSGFIIDSDGYIATNYHVVDGATEVTVRLVSGEELLARVVGTDPRTDLALLKVENGGDLPALNLGDSDSARVGDWVLAIGNPYGLGGSVTAGIISARGRDIQASYYDDFLQIDAPINSGNSGGPIFNAAGEVIGINTAIYSPNGGSVGIGFAIPSNQARSVLDELIDSGAVSRGWLGVQWAPADLKQYGAGANRSGLSGGGGARIAAVVAGSPAADAGLMPGDIITEFDGQTIDSGRELSRIVGALDAGDEVDIEFQRDGQSRNVSTVLGALDESQTRAALDPAQQNPQGNRFYRGQPSDPRSRR